ncbi:hypothetical protein NLJ89_g10090 [Agrocybe chaxingu]|uniref:Cytochrome P450 monooxygenase pc-3 n=1 Tax=Agrocybe chaxingu TaxID=84603 RepID=A0A9W8MP92_9AGAR|nr:hypothetical protein NLJ89_g10090 [Agrocybe chaxingu]
MGTGRAPGLTYLQRVVPHFAIPSAVVYLALRIANDFLPITIPSWVIIPATLFARPIIFFASSWYSDIANKRDAAARGAVMAPMVNASSFKIIGDIVETLKGGFPAEHFTRWAEECGSTYQMRMLSTNAIFTEDPEFVKNMLATQFDAFEKGPTFREQLDSLLGTGVFNADGEMWKFHRSLTRPFFTRERISDFEIYDRKAEASLKLAKQRFSEGYSINAQDLIGRFTLDSATEFLFGHSVDSLAAGLPYPPKFAHLTPASFHTHPSNIFVQAFGEGQIIAARRTGQGPDWALFEFFKDTVKPYRDVVDEFTIPVIREAVERREKMKDVKSDGWGTLLESLLDETHDPQILKDELVNLLVAGRETTMAFLTFAVYMISEHPEFETRLRQEIYDKVGPSGRPTYENVRELKFMRAFLNGSEAVSPCADQHEEEHQASCDPEQASRQAPDLRAREHDLHVRRDQHAPAHRPLGPDAMVFDPDRFLDERLHKYLTPNPFIFSPFNAGPRICLGQQFAYHEATFYLIRLLQHFTEFKLDTETNKPPPASWAHAKDRKKVEKIHLMSHLNMFVPGGLWLRMKEIQPGEVNL